MKVVITDANNAAGLAILSCEQSQSATIRLIPAVRSERAGEDIRRLLGKLNGIVQISYDDPESLISAFREASAITHLPGVLVERLGSTYDQANLVTTQFVVGAAKPSAVRKFVLVSAI
jgi:hypothetical protein